MPSIARGVFRRPRHAAPNPGDEDVRHEGSMRVLQLLMINDDPSRLGFDSTALRTKGIANATHDGNERCRDALWYL